MDALGEVMQLLKCTLELGIALVVGSIHTEHAYEHLLKHRGLAVCGRYVLAQVARLDMEARKLGAIADDREIAAIDKLAILRALDDANKVVLGERADNEISTPNISGMVSMGCSFCLVSLGSVLSGTSDSKPTS